MFIKKDLRKIPEILEDQNDDRSDLFLARRYESLKLYLEMINLYIKNSKVLSTLFLDLQNSKETSMF